MIPKMLNPYGPIPDYGDYTFTYGHDDLRVWHGNGCDKEVWNGYGGPDNLAVILEAVRKHHYAHMLGLVRAS